MKISSRNNEFAFEFPKVFFPDSIVKKYDKYFNRIPGYMTHEPKDLFNYAIQSLNLPGPSFDPIQQKDHPGSTRNYRANLQDTEVYDRQLIITCQTFDGFSNYFMALDLFRYYYDFSNRGVHLPFDFEIKVLDFERHVISSVVLKEPIFTSVSGLEFNFSNKDIDFKTFDMTFVYNEFDIKINLD